jgi:hypothetical protein
VYGLSFDSFDRKQVLDESVDKKTSSKFGHMAIITFIIDVSPFDPMLPARVGNHGQILFGRCRANVTVDFLTYAFFSHKK